MKYKYSIGQTVTVKMSDRWVGDYTIKATVLEYCPLFMNGVPTYKVKTVSDEILTEIVENDLLCDQEGRKNSIHYPEIHFPNKESANEYSESLKEKGWHEISRGLTINIEEVKRRIFNKGE